MEILSPAGSFEALVAAVNYGADAVYVGGNRFSARRNAQNFSDEELKNAVDFCHVRGVKLYVCCNTLMKETELSAAMSFIRFLYEIGVDALIIQDLGLFSRVRQELPEMPVHASTQMTVTNSDGVNLLSEMGAKRVVLAREVTKEALVSICRSTEAELEYFVHGALCISYSGQCLMSSLLGTRSGNRGGCAQPCRLPYTLFKDGKPITKKLALLCPKDLCLADRVQELKDLGVSSLKIEGRMKSPEYVAMVTAVYKRAVTEGVSDKEIQNMLKFFSRGGSCPGYFDGCSFEDMMDPVGNSKIATELPALAKKKRQVPIYLSLRAFPGEAMVLTMTAESGETVTAVGDICEEARVRATEKERMEEQLKKLGETPFFAKKIEIFAGDTVAVSVKALNGLRRQAAEALEMKLAEGFRRKPITGTTDFEAITVQKRDMSLCAEVMTEEQLKAAVTMGIKRIYLPEALSHFSRLVEEPVLQLHPLFKEGMKQQAIDFSEVCVQNIGQIDTCRGKNITAGHRLNITNSETVRTFAALGAKRFVLSPELNLKNIMAVRRHTDSVLEVIGYGRLPLMLLENCVIKSAGKCGCDQGTFSLLDRKNELFPLLPTRCGNVIYNSKPVYMAERLEEVSASGVDAVRLSFTTESYEECLEIIRNYQAGLLGKPVRTPGGQFTRGHFYRGMQ